MKTRIEHDLLGEKEVPAEAYYGIQTLRGIENFHNISGITISDYPNYVKALAMVKWAAAKANQELQILPDNIADAITHACEEIIGGKLHDQFPVDLIQGGAGTSTNMNINEVVANRALELMGHEKGEYQYCHPNNHVNMSQSTNDAYPTAFKLAFIFMNEELVADLRLLIQAFHQKGEEFKEIIKMGRTQLQDAVPMTVGQEFEAFAATLEEEVKKAKDVLASGDIENIKKTTDDLAKVSSGIFQKMYAAASQQAQSQEQPQQNGGNGDDNIDFDVKDAK